ncbi:response regulator transcription factor [Erythrobacter sp. T5W1-R]|uniref:response regulator transcription factor n=1 Tax=Erythrobacter sp. T5W1-R TaxID=3101752 RepID=UPI002AFF0400|nr:response regulator transcription factor [Erythrobacter sp. T5W1-R]MEA1619269.1 response regulator transcription factor [Erythrobacter sp. T5W1-R]
MGNAASPSLSGYRILIVEDEPEIAEILFSFLTREEARCMVVRDGGAVREALWRWHPQLVLLDMKLPKRNGWSVLADLRETHPDLPVMVISALGDDVDKLSGFRLGCDDYVVKPFNPLEIVARASVLLRRGHVAAPIIATSHGALRIDRGGFRAFYGDRLLDLTRVEFLLLDALVNVQGRVVSRGFLIETALDGDAFDRSVDPHISRLRQKLASVAGAQVTIAAVHGEGYRLDVVG